MSASPIMELITLGLTLGSCWLMHSSRWRFPICLSLVLRLQLKLDGSEEWPLHQKLTFNPTQATQHPIPKPISCFWSVVCFVWVFGRFFCFGLVLGVCLFGFCVCLGFFSSDITSILGVVSLVLPYPFHSALGTVAALAFNKTFYFGQLLWPNATTTPATNAKLLYTSWEYAECS